LGDGGGSSRAGKYGRSNSAFDRSSTHPAGGEGLGGRGAAQLPATGAGAPGSKIAGPPHAAQLPSGPGAGGGPSNRPPQAAQLPSGPGAGGGPGNRPAHPAHLPSGPGSGWNGWGDYPPGAGLVAGAVVGAAVASAAYGTAYYELPYGCSPYPWEGYSYYSCGDGFYEPRYEGETIVYVTVPDPRIEQQPPPP